MAELAISITKIPPTTTKATILPVSKPITASVAPKDSAPPSPNQILAGQMLKYKKASKVPVQRAINSETGVSRFPAAIVPKTARQIKSSPVANPSRPSVMLKAFVKETITKVANGIYQIPRSITIPSIGIFSI